MPARSAKLCTSAEHACSCAPGCQQRHMQHMQMQHGSGCLKPPSALAASSRPGTQRSPAAGSAALPAVQAACSSGSLVRCTSSAASAR